MSGQTKFSKLKENMSNFDLNNISSPFNNFNQELQNALVNIGPGFCWTSAIIYVIFALINFILIGYILSMNGDSSITPTPEQGTPAYTGMIISKVAAWILYALAILFFLVGFVIYSADWIIPNIGLYQKIILVIFSIIEASLLFFAMLSVKLGNNVIDQGQNTVWVIGNIMNAATLIVAWFAFYDKGRGPEK